MRIVSGKYRGRKLLDFKGREIRPTTDMVKESLFNLLQKYEQPKTVLDLFCGTGGVGIEAISRYSSSVVFCDKSKESLDICKKNLKSIGEEQKTFLTDYKSFLLSAKSVFDLIFLDPPYNSGYGEDALSLIATNGILNDNGIAVFESEKPFSGEIKGLKQIDERRYGRVVLTIFSKEINGEKQ